jgi:D-sedoheptulose 7-phosphate isomerase
MRRYIGEIREGAVEAALAVLKARRILTCGNGGSAHNAFHAALDWSKVGNKHAESLGEAGELSAHSNDDGFSVALANMLASRRLAKGDLLVCFSASGNSANVCWAAEAARSRGAKVVALTQASKCEIEKHSHICVRALQSLDGSPWSYGRIEDEAARWMHATTALLHGLQA